MLAGEASGDRVLSALGSLVLEARGLHGAVDLVVRPEQLEVDPAGLDTVAATVEDRVFYGHDALLRLRLSDGTSVTARTPGAALAAPGSQVRLGCRGGVVAFAR